MMKLTRYLLMASLFFAYVSVFAQEKRAFEVPGVVKRLSLTSTLGTHNFTAANLTSFKASSLKNVTLGQLGVNYRLTENISVGLSSFGNLGNCLPGYYLAEGGFVPFDEDGMPDLDDLDDDDDDWDDDDGPCDEDDLGQNVMATVTVFFSESFPVFIQASGGFEVEKRAPAYTAMLGYRKKLIGGLGLIGGIRYSQVLYQLPKDGYRLANNSAFNVELGLNWQFAERIKLH